MKTAEETMMKKHQIKAQKEISKHKVENFKQLKAKEV